MAGTTQDAGHPGWRGFVVFTILSLLLLGAIPLLSLATGASMDFDAAGARAAADTGIAWTSNLLAVLRLCLVEPSLWLLVLGSAIPSFAGMLAASSQGRRSVQRLLARLIPWGAGASARGIAAAYLVPFAALPVCLFATYALRGLLPGPDYAQPENLIGPAFFSALLLSALLDQGGVLEELGWRGFAQQDAQTRLSSLAAALLVGTVWGLWHIPRDVFAGVIERLGALQYTTLYLPSFLLGTITVSIVAAWCMNRAGGSVWPAIVVHGITNDALGIAGLADINTALTPYHQFTKAVPTLVLVVAFVWFSGRELGMQPPQGPTPESAPRYPGTANPR
ncbi:MAG: CPBP family intramembrane metalloprotease [Candidatus Hydrogenedens sp.]|nr:CPBP family intramembrane metalloprotease [Candidatus Hydrogenedens sp.]